MHTLDLTITEGSLPAKQAVAYREFLRRARETNAVVFRMPVKGNAFISTKPGGKGKGGINWWWVALIFAILAIGRIVSAVQDTPTY